MQISTEELERIMNRDGLKSLTGSTRPRYCKKCSVSSYSLLSWQAQINLTLLCDITELKLAHCTVYSGAKKSERDLQDYPIHWLCPIIPLAKKLKI